MLTVRLALGILITLVAAALAARIGRQFLRNARPGDDGRALRRFGVWWIFLAIDASINQTTWLLGALSLDAPWIVAPLTFAAVLSIGVMLWGLASYILYLFTGRTAVFRAVTIFYVAQVSAMLALVAYLRPNGATVGTWGGEVAYAVTPPAWAALAVALFFLVPPIVAAIALATLIPRTRDKVARRRIAALASGIAAWFLGSIVVGAAGGGSDVAALAGFGLSLGCMLLIARAYAPLRGVPPRSDAAERDLLRRVHELV